MMLAVIWMGLIGILMIFLKNWAYLVAFVISSLLYISWIFIIQQMEIHNSFIYLSLIFGVAFCYGYLAGTIEYAYNESFHDS